MITRMQDRPMLCRLTHLGLLMSSLTALCVLLRVCQLLSQMSQLPLVLLLELNDSMLLMVTTGRHLSATQIVFRSSATELVLRSGPECRSLHVLTCM